jgi:hypothetical protein
MSSFHHITFCLISPVQSSSLNTIAPRIFITFEIYNPNLIRPFNFYLLNDLPQGYPTCFDKRPKSLSWADLLAAHVKITISGVHELINYCAFLWSINDLQIWPPVALRNLKSCLRPAGRGLGIPELAHVRILEPELDQFAGTILGSYNTDCLAW